MLEDVLRYPWGDGDGLEQIALGSLFSFLGFLIVPAILVAGYFVRVIDETLQGNDAVPELERYDKLFYNGLKANVIAGGYAVMLAVIFSGGLLLAGGLAGDSGITIVVGILIALAATVFLLLIGLIVPAGIIVMVDRGSLLAGFNLAIVLPLAFSRSYLSGWLVAFAALLIGSFVGGIVSPTVVGPVIVSYYSLISSARAYALGARKELSSGP